MQTFSTTTGDISKIIDAFNQDKVACFPTDTIYGMGCSAYSDIAAEKIIKLKKRDKSKNFVIFLPNINEIEKIAILNKQARSIINKFMPGALTVILKAKDNIKFAKYVVNKEKNTIAIRIPGNIFLNELMREYKQPIIATSVNISGEEPALRACNIELKADLIIERDAEISGICSTIIDLSEEKLTLLREGGISFDSIYSNQ